MQRGGIANVEEAGHVAEADVPLMNIVAGGFEHFEAYADVGDEEGLEGQCVSVGLRGIEDTGGVHSRRYQGL